MSEASEFLTVRQSVSQAPRRVRDAGLMVCVVQAGGIGYAATSELTAAGLARAFSQARSLALASAKSSVFDFSFAPQAVQSGEYRSTVQTPVNNLTLTQRFELLTKVSHSVAGSAEIVDWSASLATSHIDQLLIASNGTVIEQSWDFVVPSIRVTAHKNGVTQTRTSAGQYNGFCQQGGLEVLDRARFIDDGERVARQAIELTTAAQCPDASMDVILMPDQMMLQIHESIGHPLELDRILGDERNFAGTSFVSPDMFGHYQYGSPLLNVSYAPDVIEEFASFGFDDEGAVAQRTMLIEQGILQQPLGAGLSHARLAKNPLGAPISQMTPLATSRSCSWNRAPIDRMSNLNVEPGSSSLEQMIASIDYGVMLHTNCSWSIDDSRNKFQFGCEYGRMIREGQLAEVVRNSNYRGVSATFWRSLAMVGDRSTHEVMGTPFCGKGEPAQVIHVGHAAPACKFENVAVFGGAAS
jgi:predicted Zn-dependent protease